jgi:hypothetical protein
MNNILFKHLNTHGILQINNSQHFFNILVTIKVGWVYDDII